MGCMKSFCITKFSDSRGQSVVEYLLLLFVIVGLSTAIIRSEGFQTIMGEDSFFFQKLKQKQEYSFRHTHFTDIVDDTSYTGEHHSYINPTSNVSRFFAPAEEYPE